MNSTHFLKGSGKESAMDGKGNFVVETEEADMAGALTGGGSRASCASSFQGTGGAGVPRKGGKSLKEARPEEKLAGSRGTCWPVHLASPPG